jgi:hypothetical protein
MAIRMNHHRDCGSDNDLDGDRARWNRDSYSAHPIDSMEPLSDEPNGYRAAAIHHLGIMYAVDDFITAAPDARVAVVAVAVVLGWPSARGFSIGDIADQLGVLAVDVDSFDCPIQALAGLGVSAAGVRFIRPGAGSDGDKPGGGSGVRQSKSDQSVAGNSPSTRIPSTTLRFIEYLGHRVVSISHFTPRNNHEHSTRHHKTSLRSFWSPRHSGIIEAGRRRS